MVDDHQKLAERQATDSYRGLQQKPILPNTWIWDFQPRCVRITWFCLKLPSLSLFSMAGKTNSQVFYGCLKFCDSFSPVSCKGEVHALQAKTIHWCQTLPFFPSGLRFQSPTMDMDTWQELQPNLCFSLMIIGVLSPWNNTIYPSFSRGYNFNPFKGHNTLENN